MFWLSVFLHPLLNHHNAILSINMGSSFWDGGSHKLIVGSPKFYGTGGAVPWNLANAQGNWFNCDIQLANLLMFV